MNCHTSMPLSLRTSLGATSACLPVSRPSKRSGGSTAWSSTLTRIMSSSRMASPLLCHLTLVSVYVDAKDVAEAATTENSCQDPGTLLSSWTPASENSSCEPTTRSTTVRDTRT